MPDASSPWWTTLLIAVATAAVPSLAGYLAVEKHAQRMKEKEQLLTREQFEAEQVAKYLTLPHKDVLTKRAIPTQRIRLCFGGGPARFGRTTERRQTITRPLRPRTRVSSCMQRRRSKSVFRTCGRRSDG
jgi:hypothetical protein